MCAISYYILKEGSNQLYRGASEERQIEGLIENSISFNVEAFDKEGNSSISTISIQTLSNNNYNSTTLVDEDTFESETTTTTTYNYPTTTTLQLQLQLRLRHDYHYNYN